MIILLASKSINNLFHHSIFFHSLIFSSFHQPLSSVFSPFKNIPSFPASRTIRIAIPKSAIIMKSLAPSGCFNFKLHNPCKKIVQCFKFKARKPFFIRKLHFRLPKRSESRTKPTTKRSVAKLLSALLSSLRQPQKETDQVTELKCFPETVHPSAPFPSPMTPAYVKANAAAAATKEALYQDEVEDACRSFESYLVDMIVEDAKVKDLTNVEELLYCWKNLKCPVFTDLVCRFYGELCKDLFTNSSEHGSDSSNSPNSNSNSTKR